MTNSTDAEPTPKQIELAHRLGLIVPPNVTKVSLYRRIGRKLKIINDNIESDILHRMRRLGRA